MSPTRAYLEKRIRDLRTRLASVETALHQAEAALHQANKEHTVKIATPTTIDTELMDVLKHHVDHSMRARLRAVAAYIAVRQQHEPRVPREVLRAYCKALRIYDTATFSYYMADSRYAKSAVLFVEVDGGWSLTEAGEHEADRLFPERLVRAVPS